MYLLAGLMVVIFVALGYLDKKADKVLFATEILVLTFMLCFRYGQGTDYFGYEVNYSLIPQAIDINFLFHNDVHGEIGYTFIVEIFRSFGLSFPAFVACCSFVMMLMTYHGIKSYGCIKTIAILLLYPTYYLTFYYSGIRQGFALAFTICFILPAYVEGKKIQYVLLVCLGAAIHTSALVLLIPLLVGKIVKKQKQMVLVGAVMLGLLLGIFLRATDFKWGHYVQFSPSYAAIALRIILFVTITRLYQFLGEKDEVNDRIYQFYLVGFYLFLALSPMAFVSHRTTAYMKISEVILFSRLLENVNEAVYVRKFIVVLKRRVCSLIIAICMIESIKNINSYVAQGEYYPQIHFYNYPYVSVFHKEDIYKYRENGFLESFPDVF